MGTKANSLEVNAFQGGLNTASKKLLIEKFTTSIRKYAGYKPDEPAPVYIILRDVPACNGGVFGENITLHDLHNPSASAKPI